MFYREPVNEDPIYVVVSGGILIFPGDVVAGACGHDFHVIVRCKVFSISFCLCLRASGYVFSVALDRNEDFLFVIIRILSPFFDRISYDAPAAAFMRFICARSSLTSFRA